MARPKAGITFWNRVVNQTDFTQRDGCFYFNGNRDSCGYGRVRKNGKTLSLHRESYREMHGEIPAGKYILHKCDHPSYWNVEHLYLGTQFENMRDCKNRGRMVNPRGSKSGMSKLNEEKVAIIKNRINNGEKIRKIALDNNIDASVVWKIKAGKLWAHVNA